MSRAQMKNKSARTARDAGILKALDHAEDVSTGWAGKASEALRLFAAAKRSTGQEFTSEEVRSSIIGAAVPEPPHPRAWGGIFRAAAINGLIVKTGTTQSKAPHCHLSYVSTWRAV